MAQRFTIYDNYKFPPKPMKPAEYPKMLYHPTGEMVQTASGDEQMTFSGPKLRNVHFELVHRVVHNASEEAMALNEGWHKTPKASREAGAKAAGLEKAASGSKVSARA